MLSNVKQTTVAGFLIFHELIILICLMRPEAVAARFIFYLMICNNKNFLDNYLVMLKFTIKCVSS